MDGVRMLRHRAIEDVTQRLGAPGVAEKLAAENKAGPGGNRSLGGSGGDENDASQQEHNVLATAGSTAARRREKAIREAALSGPIREELMVWRQRFESGGMKQPVDVSDYNLHLSVVQVRQRHFGGAGECWRLCESLCVPALVLACSPAAAAAPWRART